MADKVLGEQKDEEKWVPIYCYQCNTGAPDLLKVHVVNGVAVGVEPNYDFASIHPGEARICVKACGLINKHYNPSHFKTPFAKDLKIPNLNQIAPALIELTDEGGGSKDHVKVKVYPVRGGH